MKALLVVPRLPGTGHTGDRLRAEIHLAALHEAGFEVTVAGGAPPGGAPDVPGAERTISVPQPHSSKAAGLVRALVSGAPLQSALFSGPWKETLARGGSFDLIVLLLPQRLFPHAGDALPAGPRVVDYVDALGAAARQAARKDPALWRRLYWRFEAPRLSQMEQDAARGARLLVATTAFDAGELPAGTLAAANGVTVRPVSIGPRGAAVAFTGRLRYRPNELAVRELLREIWPRVRREAPEARLLLGGADVPPEFRRVHGAEGVDVTSPVEDMAVFLRRARVVAVPVTLGTGTPNKLFEAFEAGCAVVASPEVVARAAADGVSPPARVARTSGEFASALLAYLRDAGSAVEDGRRGRAWIEAHADRRLAIATLASACSRAREDGG
ncbi:MAG: glycosyltransferase [Thermoanaerobaculia bacterium]